MRKDKDSEINKKKKKEYAKEYTLTLTPSAAASPPCGSRPPSRPPHPAGRRRPTLGLLRPTAEQARRGTTLLPAAPSRRRGGGTRATARRRLAARDDFRLVVIRPVVEADSKPGAASFPATRLGVFVHGGRPQVVVLQVMLRPVGEKSALRPRLGRRSKERALPRRADWSESAKENSATKLREERVKESVP